MNKPDFLTEAFNWLQNTGFETDPRDVEDLAKEFEKFFRAGETFVIDDYINGRIQ